jgi:hypothetical protein
MRKFASPGAVVAMVLGAVVVVSSLSVAPAGASGSAGSSGSSAVSASSVAQDRCRRNPATQLVECEKGWALRPPNPDGTPQDPPEGGPPPLDLGLDCGYVEVDPESWAGFVPPPPSPDAILVFPVCYLNGEQIQSIGWDTAPGWMVPGQDPPPNPAVIAAALNDRVRATLQDPVLTTSPDPGQPAVYRTPTFVAVDNWQGTQSDRGCLSGGGVTVCVAIVAEPTLTFDPGDGSDPVACEPGGTVFDESPGSAGVDAQAAPPACAHEYRQRTGVDGRPAAWPGVVTVNWDITWTVEGGGGGGGAFEPEILSAPLPRAVEEGQTVVNG